MVDVDVDDAIILVAAGVEDSRELLPLLPFVVLNGSRSLGSLLRSIEENEPSDATPFLIPTIVFLLYDLFSSRKYAASVCCTPRERRRGRHSRRQEFPEALSNYPNCP